MLSNVNHIIRNTSQNVTILIVRWAISSRLKEALKHRIMKERKKAINLNWHIHLGSSIKIPKYFKHNKYFSHFRPVFPSIPYRNHIKTFALYIRDHEITTWWNVFGKLLTAFTVNNIHKKLHLRCSTGL